MAKRNRQKFTPAKPLAPRRGLVNGAPLVGMAQERRCYACEQRPFDDAAARAHLAERGVAISDFDGFLTGVKGEHLTVGQFRAGLQVAFIAIPLADMRGVVESMAETYANYLEAMRPVEPESVESDEDVIEGELAAAAETAPAEEAAAPAAPKKARRRSVPQLDEAELDAPKARRRKTKTEEVTE